MRCQKLCAQIPDQLLKGRIERSSFFGRIETPVLRGIIDKVVQGGGGGGEEYTGPYEATPTQGTQIFATAGKSMLHDFVVNPIPSNYGLITWNGAVLTVS